MRQFKFVAVMFAAIVLAACGGSDNASSNANANANSNKIKFSSQVSFGDSLTDVGTYAVGTIKALGGGKYTINSATAKNWTEVVAAQLDLPAPCAAQTGLDGDAAQGFSVPVTNFPNCTGYAQGGARVTNPVGPGNKQLGGAGATLGLLTVPVVRQIWNHLAAHGNAFKGDEVVFVMAGGNDLFINLDTLSASAAAAGTEAGAAEAANSGATQQSITDAAQAAAAAYVQAHAAETVQAMGVAGAELAGYVNNLILGKGAKYVVVVNLPDASKSPASMREDAATQSLINTMVTTFNTQLSSGLGSNPSVLYVDAYTVSRDEIANPVQYGLTNVSSPACDISKLLTGNSLVCTTATLVPGVVDKYLFADNSGHMTPYGYELLAKTVLSEMTKKGWL